MPTRTFPLFGRCARDPAWSEPGAARALRSTLRRAARTTAFALLVGCDPVAVVGSRFCAAPPDDGGVDANLNAPVDLPWSTGFEDGWCDYAQPQGFCFATGDATYTLVTSPVHSGKYAAAFSVRSDVDGGSQVRCVEQGMFPAAAYYGAWYYVPAPPPQNTGTGVWNLFHFQGGDPSGSSDAGLAGLWDVSLVSLSDGGTHTVFYDFITKIASDPTAAPAVPIGRWFHIEVYFKRDANNMGELSMWQDDRLAVHYTGIQTDPSNWGQWYVGNLATALMPPSSTLYVDDVTISTTQ